MDTQSLFSLAGRTALVTGGSRGIGKMIASGFIAQGAKVYISSRKADVCEAVANELGPNCIAVPQDISTVDGCKALAATMAEHESGVDILVNNAGAAWGAAFETFPEAGWDKIMNLNVKSIFFSDSGNARAAKDRRLCGTTGKGHQYCLDRWFTTQPLGNLQLSGVKSGRNQPHQATRRATGQRRHSRYGHRAGRFCF